MGEKNRMPKPRLLVILPVYNEEAALRSVLEEWLAELRLVLHEESFVFTAWDDGSQDGSVSILEECAARNPELKVLRKSNSGHGQTCMMGYGMAAESDAEWILQIDSDGQCDPRFFQKLWALRDQADAVFGFRKIRQDGLTRNLISRILSVAVFLCTGTWVRDPNVPYRMVRTRLLKMVLPLVPGNAHLVNVFLSVLLERSAGIRWVDIAFRARSGGYSSVKGFSFVRQGIRLMGDLRAFQNARKAAIRNDR